LFVPSTVSFTILSHSSRSNIRNHRKGSFSDVLLSLSSDDDESSFISSEEERMEYVRELQKTFYTTSNKNEDDEYEDSDTKNMIVNEQTGLIKNLPLWRVGWVELPGRANCLNVHESEYTHMFETILNSQDEGPFYVGHLYIPGGFQSALQEKNLEGEKRFELKNYKDELLDDRRFTQERSKVIGTLMRISDYRRRKDGKLTLLVHPIERFAVTNVVQQFPYSVADVQLLPDFEKNSDGKSREMAVRETFQYMSYEHDTEVKLPLPVDDPYVDSNIEFQLNDFSKILPFAHYSKDDSTIQQQDSKEQEDNDTNVVSNESSSLQLEKQGILSLPPFIADFSKLLPFATPFFSSNNKDDDSVEEQKVENMNVDNDNDSEELEKQLENGGLIALPPFIAGPESVNRRSLDSSTLERMIWNELDEFCRITQFTLPEEIRCLMPPSCTELKTINPPAQFLSNKYPMERRRRRLSYSAPSLLERTGGFDRMTFRQMWFNTPGTRSRLAVVLERFELINGLIRDNQPQQQGASKHDEEEDDDLFGQFE